VLSLLLGAVLRVGSYLDLAHQTRRRRWQQVIHWAQAISDDTFGYVTERLKLEDLRQGLADVAKPLKANKALESCRINGLLFLSLDANEHFKSRSRCCPDCCQRTVEELDAHGQKQTVIEYYHRYVFAQINGPKLNVLLDLEPIRPGEAEAQAALRLLGRIRRVYGVRFFDAVTVDAWYVQGPFLNAVKKLGWRWQVVLKQERMEVFQEARQLSQGRPGCSVRWRAPSTDAEVAANAAPTLFKVACALLNRPVASQAAAFDKDGGVTERLHRVRSWTRRPS
jgi:four helix bundle suffix protein